MGTGRYSVDPTRASVTESGVARRALQNSTKTNAVTIRLKRDIAPACTHKCQLVCGSVGSGRLVVRADWFLLATPFEHMNGKV